MAYLGVGDRGECRFRVQCGTALEDGAGVRGEDEESGVRAERVGEGSGDVGEQRGRVAVELILISEPE